MPETLSPQKQRVKEALEGFAERQRQRDRNRQHGREVQRITKARYAGKLKTLPEARAWLTANGIRFREKVEFGVTLLTAFPGVLLPFRPDEVLDWQAMRRMEREEEDRQAALFELPTGE